MLSKIKRANPVSEPVPRMDAMFADKRVIPPFHRSETRIAGTLHLPGAQLRAARA